MDSSSSSGSTKRARATVNGTQVPLCLVDGCNSDLSKCRDYHRRHKVCELHSKTPKVTIRGQEQRFCQQCSRLFALTCSKMISTCIHALPASPKEFQKVQEQETIFLGFHSLGEFDEGKRSCRKRLDGHNRRRRKPQPDSLSLNSGRFNSSYQGTRILSFTSPQIFPQGAVVSSPWTGTVKAESDAALYNSYSQLNYSDRKNSINPGSLYDNYKGGKQFPFSQGSSSSLLGASISQPLLDANFASSNDSRSQKVFSNGLNQVIDSDCALSLLSSTPTETRQVGLSNMVQSNPIHTGQSLVPSLHYNGFGMEVKENSSALGSRNTNIHCQGMFSIGPHDSDGSSATGPNQTLSFLWE